MAKNVFIRADAHFGFTGEKYESFVKECYAGDIKENYVYTINALYKQNGNVKVRIYAAFTGDKGKELAKGYVEDGIPFTTVLGTRGIIFQILTSSKSQAVFDIEGIYIKEEHPYKERNVILAATALKYDRPKRTFEKNLNDTLDALDAAAKEKPDIIVSSECFYSRNVRLPDVRDRSVALDSEPVRIFRQRAEKYKTNLCFSLHTILENGNIANLGILIDRKGNIAGTYKKTHLAMGELLSGIEPGEEIGLFDLDFGRVGIAICWDLFFPEYVRQLHLGGVDVILNPTAGFKAERTSRRALESGAFIVTSGSHKASETRITEPNGSFADIGDYERGYAAAKVDLNKDYYIKWLSSMSYSQGKNVYKYERRPDLYK